MLKKRTLALLLSLAMLLTFMPAMAFADDTADDAADQPEAVAVEEAGTEEAVVENEDDAAEEGCQPVYRRCCHELCICASGGYDWFPDPDSAAAHRHDVSVWRAQHREDADHCCDHHCVCLAAVYGGLHDLPADGQNLCVKEGV